MARKTTRKKAPPPADRRTGNARARARSRGLAEKKAAFVEALRKRGSVYHGAKAAGVGRSTVYEWRDEDADFAKAWDAAYEDALDVLEASAYERATYGVVEPVASAGVVVGERRVYSDGLVGLLLKGRRSQIFRDRHEVSGPNGGAIATRDETPHAPYTRDELDEVARILADARGAAREDRAEEVDPASAAPETGRISPAT